MFEAEFTVTERRSGLCVALSKASGTEPASSPPSVPGSEMLLASGLSFPVYSLSVKLVVALL